jgi:hypothetical protein
VLASGGVGAPHISGFHRFFARARWSLDAVGAGDYLVVEGEKIHEQLFEATDVSVTRVR